MKHIRMKVKTLISLIGIFLLLVIFADTIFWRAIGFYNAAVPDEYEIDVMKMSADQIENENLRLEQILSEHNYDLYDLVWIGDGAVASGSRIRNIDSRKVYDQYTDFMEDRDASGSNAEYALNVALVQWFAGETDKAKWILDSIDPEEVREKTRDRYFLIRSGMELAWHDLESAKVFLDGVSGSEYMPLTNKIKEFMAVFYGFDVPYERVDIGMDMIEKYRYIGYYSELIELTDTWTSEYYAKGRAETLPQSGSKLSGVVTRNGKPLEGVFLYEDVDPGMFAYEGFHSRIFVTDESGRYEIENLDPKAKRIGLIIPWQLIHDQQWARRWEEDFLADSIDFAFTDGVRFKTLFVEEGQLVYDIFDSVNDPDRMYMMKIRSTNPDFNVNGSTIDWEIKSGEMSGKIPLEEIIKRSGFSNSYSSSDDESDIKRFLEPLYLADEYYFEVMPYGEDREQYISNGLFSDALAVTLEVEGQEAMSEGDILLSKGKIEEAIEWYDLDGSQHSLKVLTALYTRGYIPAEGNAPQWELGGSDHSKAAEYLERLILTSGETNDRLRQLAREYKESFQFEKVSEILIRLNENLTQGGSETVYVEMDIARNLIHQGEYESGISHYQKVVNPELDGDRYFAYCILGRRTELLPPEYSEALLGVEGFNEFEAFKILIEAGEYTDAWEWLDERPDSDIKTFYALLMLDGFKLEDFSYEKLKSDLGLEDSDGFIDFYVQKTKGIKDPWLAKILRMLKEDSNWF